MPKAQGAAQPGTRAAFEIRRRSGAASMSRAPDAAWKPAFEQAESQSTAQAEGMRSRRSGFAVWRVVSLSARAPGPAPAPHWLTMAA
ncbi:hypothetical protein [Brevundimonas sp. DWR2-3-1b1]|uniref:hypothetical protein n=1 Tax=unclassified Brevundimonas TaxID=2622653 RepID=UPI003CEDF274